MKKKEIVTRLDAITEVATRSRAFAMKVRRGDKKTFVPSDDLVEGVLCGIAAMSAGAAIMTEEDDYPTDNTANEEFAILLDEGLKIANERRKSDEGGDR